MLKSHNGLHLDVLDWKMLSYGKAFNRQKDLVSERIEERSKDRLILVEHPPVVTIGRSGNRDDISYSKDLLSQKGIEICYVDRGGRATFHGPGQLVVYPIIRLEDEDLHAYLQKLLKAVLALLHEFGLEAKLKEGFPGIWVNDAKIASVGIAVKKKVTYHGLSLNVNTDLDGFTYIVPCGQPGQAVTSMKRELGVPLDLTQVKRKFADQFVKSFGYARSNVNSSVFVKRNLPDWLVKPSADIHDIEEMQHLFEQWNLSTVCQSADCPNLSECFSRKTATFMILGDRCTRNCRFCAVRTESPLSVDLTEPVRLAQVVKHLGLQHVVVTSVTRDDLFDGGADQFAETIRQLNQVCPQTTTEVLVPDFQGSTTAVDTVCNAGPDMFNHNIETVPRLYSLVRPGASFRRSLDILAHAAARDLPVKSGIMLGLGETDKEIKKTLHDIWQTGCRYLTIGQYLSPSEKHLPVTQYITPEAFYNYEETARNIGFINVASGPLVRSSYRAADLFPSKK